MSQSTSVSTGGGERRAYGSVRGFLSIESLTKRFGSVTAVGGVDLDVEEGEFLTLLGPSGCGKTTLLRCVAGLESTTAGRILVDGRDVTRLPPEKRPMNIVFQQYALFPHLSVTDNIAFGLRLKRLPAKERSTRVDAALELVRLPGYGDRKPFQLSGGQAQRVALARALVNEPKVLLLDEPLAALDRKIRQHMQQELRDLQRRTGTTFLYVTHDQEEAMAMSDRIVLMRGGRIEQIGDPPQLYLQPTTPFAAGFVGDANIVTGTVAEREDGQLVIIWHGCELASAPPTGAAPGSPVQVLLRPEALEVRDAPADQDVPTIEGDIVDTSYYGFYRIHRVRVGGDQLMVRDQGQATRPAGRCQLHIRRDRAVVLR
jgi:spermidine/putrescine transport system ATP-binding protein